MKNNNESVAAAQTAGRSFGIARLMRTVRRNAPVMAVYVGIQWD